MCKTFICFFTFSAQWNFCCAAKQTWVGVAYLICNTFKVFENTKPTSWNKGQFIYALFNEEHKFFWCCWPWMILQFQTISSSEYLFLSGLSCSAFEMRSPELMQSFENVKIFKTFKDSMFYLPLWHWSARFLDSDHMYPVLQYNYGKIINTVQQCFSQACLFLQWATQRIIRKYYQL